MAQATLEPQILTPSATEDGDRLYEIIDGHSVGKPSLSSFDTLVATILTENLGPFARARQLGRVVTEMLFALGTGEDAPQRRPDVAFVSAQRWPRDRPVPDTEAWEVVPDLAVEVIGKTNRAEELMSRIRVYFQTGVRTVWVIYPRERLIHVYESWTTIRVLGPEQELDGGQVLPGFHLPLAALFEEDAATPGPA